MKARPRAAERRVAELLSEFFVSRGFSPVERIPVLGRSGPDISINEVGLVVDVKSRLEVPLSYVHTWPSIHGDLLAFPLGLIDKLGDDDFIPSAHSTEKISTQVERWFNHMHEWTLERYKTGITALVLHRPKLPFGMAGMVIRQNQIQLLQEKICQTIRSR